MPVSEAQKRAIQKYQAKHKDKLREYSKEYYKRKKEHNDDIMMKCKCLEDRILMEKTFSELALLEWTYVCPTWTYVCPTWYWNLEKTNLPKIQDYM